MPKTITLKTQGVTSGGEPLTQLVLRDPTIADIEKADGLPWLILQDGDKPAMKDRPGVIIRMASLLAGVPPSVIRSLGVQDYNALFSAVGEFFGDEGKELPPPSADVPATSCAPESD